MIVYNNGVSTLNSILLDISDLKRKYAKLFDLYIMQCTGLANNLDSVSAGLCTYTLSMSSVKKHLGKCIFIRVLF